MTILGIDPGISGGIALYANGVVTAFKMPKTLVSQASFFEALSVRYPDLRVFLELVGTRPGQNATAMWTFGKHFGSLQAFMVCYQLRNEEVAPKDWQKYLTLGGSKDHALPGDKAHQTKARWKKFLCSTAENLYGKQTKVSLATADALLIMHYGLKKLGVV